MACGAALTRNPEVDKLPIITIIVSGLPTNFGSYR